MIGLVGIRRFGWWVLFLVLAGVIAGCSSDSEVAAPSSSPSAMSVAELDELELLDTLAITQSFFPEITEDDIEVIEGDAGMSYRYAFATRELSDGVSLDLIARWDPVEGGLQPSLKWNLTGNEMSPSDFVFTAYLPKSFGETVDDIKFDPQPDEIIDPDPIVEWVIDFLVGGTASFSATSDTIVQNDEAVAVIGSILDQANAYRFYTELTACTKWVKDIPSLTGCYLTVVAENPGLFNPDRCDALGESLLSSNPYPRWGTILSLACNNVVGLTRYGIPLDCAAPSDQIVSMGCFKMVWQLLAGACEHLDPLEQQVCVYEAAVAVGDQSRCDSLVVLGNPEMANDCRAAITKDPSYCARTADSELRASCCEDFRGTEAYDTCLGRVGEAAAEEDTTATTADESTGTTTEETVATTETFPPPPIGGDIQSVDTEWFFAEYQCSRDTLHNDGTRESAEFGPRYLWVDGRMMVELGESGDVVPLEPPHENWPYSFTNVGFAIAMSSPGPWLPLDGSSYLIAEGRSTDTNNSPYAEEIETYSDLIFEAGPATTLDEYGWEWSVIPYVGGYSYTRDILDQENTNDFTTNEETGSSFTAWYHQATGLVLATELVEERFFYETTEKGGRQLPVGVINTAGCVLVDTNLNLDG